MGIGPEPGIVLKPKDSRGGGQILFRRWVVERTFSSTVSVSSLVEGLREEPGEFLGLVTIGGMSFHDASNGPGTGEKQHRMLSCATYDSGSKEMPLIPWHRWRWPLPSPGWLSFSPCPHQCHLPLHDHLEHHCRCRWRRFPLPC